MFFSKPQKFEEGKTFYSTGVKRIPGEASQKILLAYDLDKQSFAWSYPQVGRARSSGGTMTTATGLVFFGDDAQSFEAWMPDRKAAVALQYRTGLRRVTHELCGSGQAVRGHCRGKRYFQFCVAVRRCHITNDQENTRRFDHDLDILQS